MQPGTVRAALMAFALLNLIAAIAFLCLNCYLIAFVAAVMAIAWFLASSRYGKGE